MNVYDYVDILIKERNLTVSGVEKALGFGNKTIKSWEKSFPKIDKLYAVAQFFDVSLEYFLTGDRGVTADEKVILNAYRNTDAEGKARIIQVSMNEQDRVSLVEKNEDEVEDVAV